MKNSVSSLLETAQKRMGGYTALAHYRLMNLVIKAYPEALLSFSLDNDGEKVPIEKVAQVCNAENRDDQFEIYPLEPSLLMPIIKALVKVHPEFKVEIKFPEDSNDEDERYILATMPEVDKTRHDVLMDGVGIVMDWCQTMLDATSSVTTAQIAQKLVDAPADEIDEAKDALKDLQDQHEDLCKQFRAEKEEEIESAYKEYQERKAQEEAGKQEMDAAHNFLAGKQMNLQADDE